MKVVICSYEVGHDKTATIGSILNLLQMIMQETTLNHVWMSGLLGDGFGVTHGMTRNDLIWVVSIMYLQIDHYPIWGEVLELYTWVGASGKNGMRCDWQFRSHNTGIMYARATSHVSYYYWIWRQSIFYYGLSDFYINLVACFYTCCCLGISLPSRG